MTKHSVYALFSALLLLVSSVLASNAHASDISEFTESMEANEGYYTFYFDRANDKVYLKVPYQTDAFIFQSSLPRGVGSNDLGLDRGQLGATRLAEFSVHGNRVLLIEKNTTYGTITDNEAERQSVEEAFAESVIWGFDVVAKNEDAVLINYTPFLYTDIHNIQQRLQRLNEGNFTVDTSRSVLWPDRMKSFPRNTELEAKVTFTGDGAGRYVRSVTPDPSAITVHLHHSLIQLPDEGYEPRMFHPNSGYYARGFQDYAAPLRESMDHRFIARHRLEKKDPSAAVSEPVEPIVYYLDPGVPEPVRTALLDGARWWNEGFEAIGFKDAFIVKDLPEGADPMDVRYNIIQWVHRATRGWSYGYSVADPRTGEILKGHVSLGSLRVRQDMLIAQGLLAPFADDKDTEQLMDEIETMALNRIRQLSAHEIGHTIGIAHNFASNSQDRASVMDYPHPLIKVTDDGEISLNDAYDIGLGDWDKFTVAYGYTQFDSPEAEAEGLQQLIQQSYADGFDFISDRDARPVHGGHPTAHLWNNGANATEELARLIDVRSLVLNRFGKHNLADGRPLSDIEHVLVPMYLLHRYQTEAAVKLVGGQHYRYLVKGEHQPGDRGDFRPVSADEQNQAIDTLLQTLSTEFLTLPQSIQDILVPKAYGSGDSREDFPSRMGLYSDPVTIAESSANFTLSLLLNPERLNRLSWQAQNYGGSFVSPLNLSRKLVGHVLDQLSTDTNNQVAQRVAYLTAYQLVRVMHQSNTGPEARSQVAWVLNETKDKLKEQASASMEPLYFHARLADLIEQALAGGKWPEDFTPAALPPGSPI